MWFIGVELEQETRAPPPKKKSWIRPFMGWGIDYQERKKWKSLGGIPGEPCSILIHSHMQFKF